MYEVAKHEFISWLNQYKVGKTLSEYEITLLNIILNNFEDIASKGTSRGARSVYLTDKLAESNFTPSQTPIVSLDCFVASNTKIQHLQKMEIESFRGFSQNLTFDFSKQYSTFYGPNGSGKSSLSEALEYSILGTVQEATTRKIQLEKFLKNNSKNKFVKPKLTGIINEIEQEIQPDFESYKFAFIEKNRIDSFSHIGASTPGDKAERLAALFGLSEFLSFVKGFSDSLDNKIVCENTKESELKAKIEANNKNEKDFSDKTDARQKLLNKINLKIQEIKNPELKTLDSAISYLQSDDGKGKIQELQALSNVNQKKTYTTTFFESFVAKYDKVKSAFETLNKSEGKLLALSVNSNLAAIYQAVSALTDGIDHSVCPVCKTPTTQTVVNPFENAKAELKNLKSFNEVSEDIKTAQKNLKIATNELNESISLNKEMLALLNYKAEEMEIPVPDNTVEYSKQEIKDEIKDKINTLYSLVLNNVNHKEKILTINKAAEEYNSKNEYTLEAVRLKKILSELTTNQGALSEKDKDIKATQKVLKIFGQEKKLLIAAVEKERELNTNKKNYLSAYTHIISELSNYQKELPAKMSANLSNTIKNYYNTMNSDDAEFEVMQELRMPIVSTDYISVKFKDGIETDALQILSEGHVKLLGLAILLAKAKETNQNFIILDDIVNAIDDDHRSGVANLLFNSNDFNLMQIILTCHSEPFIKAIEDLVPRNERTKKISRYVFIPSFNIDQRGIVIDYSNPKEPLELANKDLKSGDFKDAAQKCRQAAESLINRLWIKLSSTYKIQISVALASPKAIPDFSSVTDGIIKQISTFTKEPINVLRYLQQIKKDYPWFLLNKGTHHEDNQFQFEGNDVKKVYDLLVELEKSIVNLKIKELEPVMENKKEIENI